MTEDGLTIYAKWEKPKYTVNFVTNCEESKDSITREKGFVLTDAELAAPEKADDEFLGWYTDRALTKKFIPESQIVKDTTLYARWKNSDTVTYTVKYMCGDTEIATAKRQTAPRNSTVSEPAETVEGYYPETLSISAMITRNGQEIIFNYRAVRSWTYTVKYLLEGTETPVPGSTVETGTTSDQNVMITFKTFEGYTLKSDPVQKVTQVNPVVIFYYAPKTAIYHIQHWYERPNGEFGLRYIDTFNTAAGQSVTTRGQEIPVDGFTLDTSIAGTVTDGTTNIQNVLSLKLYYTRNTHQVSYQYEGDVPTGAPAVPDVANHKYQAQVTVAENPNVTGYIFIGWTAATENGTAVTTTGGKFVMPDANVVLKGSFTAAEQNYRVKYLDEDTKEEIQAMSDPKDAHFGDEIKGYTEKIEISGYTFVRADDLTVGTDNEQNIVNVYYSEDTNEDDIPDKYQITFTYVSADDDKGTVTGTTSEVATTYEITRDSVTGEITATNGPTAQHPTQPSTVTPKDGYRFEKWQQDDLTFFNSDDELRNSEYLEDQTFIAHFIVRRDLHYEIHYFYEDANGVVTEDTAAAIVSDIGVFGEKILTTTVPKESEFNGKHYVLERIEGADKQVGFNPDENIVNVYYSIDVIGKEDPDKPDNIPDKYQITFTYVSADEDTGINESKENIKESLNDTDVYNDDKAQVYDRQKTEELPPYIKDPDADRKVKVTVTELKQMQAEADYDGDAFMHDDIKAAYDEAERDEDKSRAADTENVEEGADSFIPTIPKFISGSEETLRANERGTAYHRVMECLDYNNVESFEDVQADIHRMLETERMSEVQINNINVKDIYTFVSSPIGKRVRAAAISGNMRREQPFVFEYDRQLVQGVIDLFIIEDGKIVIVDYKTDRVRKGEAGEKELIKRYSVQLDYYAKALSQLTGLEVKEKLIYSFTLGREINVGS